MASDRNSNTQTPPTALEEVVKAALKHDGDTKLALKALDEASIRNLDDLKYINGSQFERSITLLPVLVGKLRDAFKNYLQSEHLEPIRITDWQEVVKKLRAIVVEDLGIDKLDDAVLQKMILHHSTQLDIATSLNNRSYILQLYEEVSNLPKTTTIERLKHDAHISLNGPFEIGDGKLLRAVDTLTGIPLILKIALPNEKQFCEELNLHITRDGLVNVQVVQLHANYERVGLLMPMYTTSLAHLPPLETNTIFQQSNKIASAIEYIHSHGWVHLDIKASNVFISADGQWKLGDFDSARRVNCAIGPTTLPFYPISLSSKPAKANIDWFHLGLMLAIEWCCKLNFNSVIMSSITKKVDIEKVKQVVEQQSNHELKIFILDCINKCELFV